MMPFVPDNDLIYVKAEQVVRVFFFCQVFIFLKLNFLRDCLFDGTLQTLDFVKLFDVGWYFLLSMHLNDGKNKLSLHTCITTTKSFPEKPLDIQYILRIFPTKISYM